MLSPAILPPEDFETILCRALTRLRDEYPQDDLTPGLLFSRLRNGAFYVAVHRFPNKAARLVEMNGRGASLEKAIENMAVPGSKARKVRPIR